MSNQEKLDQLKQERDDKLREYEQYEKQRQDLSQKQNEVGKEIIRLNGKIEAVEEMNE